MTRGPLPRPRLWLALLGLGVLAAPVYGRSGPKIEAGEVRQLFAYVVRRLGHEPVVVDCGVDPDLPEVDAVLIEPAFAREQELIARLRARQPDVPIVCASIRAETSELREDLRPFAYLEKPFALVELELALEGELADRLRQTA